MRYTLPLGPLPKGKKKKTKWLCTNGELEIPRCCGLIGTSTERWNSPGAGERPSRNDLTNKTKKHAVTRFCNELFGASLLNVRSFLSDFVAGYLSL